MNGHWLRVGVLSGVLCLTVQAVPAAPDLLPMQVPPHVANAVHGLLSQAVALEHGEGTTRDPVRARALYCEAARAGSPHAMSSLAWMLANGRGGERDDVQAANLFAMAAERGDPYAQHMRGRFSERDGTLLACLSQAHPEFGINHWNAAGYVAGLAAARRQVAQEVMSLARRHGVNPQLALAVARVESAFDPRARSPRDAMGVMQLIPATAERFAVARPWEASDNIGGGLRYLKWLLAYFQGDVALALAGYNAGEGAVDRYRGVPPFRETREYVRKILAMAPQLRHPFDAALADPAVWLTGEFKETGS